MVTDEHDLTRVNTRLDRHKRGKGLRRFHGRRVCRRDRTVDKLAHATLLYHDLGNVWWTVRRDADMHPMCGERRQGLVDLKWAAWTRWNTGIPSVAQARVMQRIKLREVSQNTCRRPFCTRLGLSTTGQDGVEAEASASVQDHEGGLEQNQKEIGPWPFIGCAIQAEPEVHRHERSQ